MTSELQACREALRAMTAERDGLREALEGLVVFADTGESDGKELDRARAALTPKPETEIRRGGIRVRHDKTPSGNDVTYITKEAKA